MRDASVLETDRLTAFIEVMLFALLEPCVDAMRNGYKCAGYVACAGYDAVVIACHAMSSKSSSWSNTLSHHCRLHCCCHSLLYGRGVLSLDRGHHGHISSTQTHGFGATYLDGYGEGLEDERRRRLKLSTRLCCATLASQSLLWIIGWLAGSLDYA